MNINKEDYIKVIYELGGDQKRVTNKEIAGKLQLSPPSVSQMIKKLLSDDYIDYQEYKGVRLRPKGLRLGQALRKKHLLWEVFLVDKLGYPWDQVHRIAENLEHFTDDDLARRLEDFLGGPSFCPHGSPLDSRLETSLSLASFSRGSFRLVRLEDQEEVLSLATREGLRLGTSFKILQAQEEGYLLGLEGRSIKISRELAEKIFVEEEG